MHGRLTALCVVILLWHAVPLRAAEAQPAAADPALEARVMAVAAELRCLVCQNQTIADSNADLAVDLRRQVRDMLSQGKSEREVIEYMTARYGDFVRYRPPIKTTTALLWFGPAALLVGGLLVLIIVLRKRAQMGDEQFDADDDEGAGESDETSDDASDNASDDAAAQTQAKP